MNAPARLAGAFLFGRFLSRFEFSVFAFSVYALLHRCFDITFRGSNSGLWHPERNNGKLKKSKLKTQKE